ncbi:MAG: glycosyltransferase [Halobacteriovoraceae bacterium]|nr:glycosyltransferase [Halobacteriovoraceae bacterium]
MTKKNVAFFNQYSLWGGGEKWHFEMALYLKNKGHQVFIFTPITGELGKRSSQKGLTVIDVNIAKLTYLNIFFLFKLYMQIKKLNLNSIVFNSFLDVRVAAFVSKLACVKNVILRCGMPIAPKQNWAYKLAFKKGLTRLVPITYAIREEFQKNAPQLIKEIPSDKIIYNAIDLNKFSPIENHNEIFTIGNAVRLTDQKGLDLLLKSLKILKDKGIKFKAKIAGTGELEKDLKQLSNDLGLTEQVSFLGFIEDIPSFMRSIDLLAFSSRYEGAARTILEAMACNVPVVAFNTSSMSEMIESNKTGLLVKAFDQIEYAHRLQQMINDKFLRDQIVKNARQYVLQNFDQSIVYKKWVGIIFEND